MTSMIDFMVARRRELFDRPESVGTAVKVLLYIPTTAHLNLTRYCDQPPPPPKPPYAGRDPSGRR